MMVSLEKHRASSIYLKAFSDIVKQGNSNRTDLIFFILSRDHIINYLKHLKGTTSSLLLIQSKHFNISQCLSMIKNIVKIYYTEEIEIFFIEHFFKHINNSKSEEDKRNVKIHKFIGILLEIFKGLRESGLKFKNLLNDFEEREKSRSRSIELLKKESMGEFHTLYSAEKPKISCEEDDLVFEVSDSKMENRSNMHPDADQSTDSIISIDLAGIYMSRRQSLKNRNQNSLINSRKSSSKKVSRFGKSSRVTSRNSTNKKSRVNSSEVSSKRSDIFENLPKFSQKEMQEYISKNFDSSNVTSFIAGGEGSLKKLSGQGSDGMKPRYSSRDCFNSESSYSNEFLNMDGSQIEAVDPIDISVSEQNIKEHSQMDLSLSMNEVRTSSVDKDQQANNTVESFIQIEDQDTGPNRNGFNYDIEEMNVFRTDNSFEVAASIFKTSFRERNQEKSLSIVTEHADDYDTSKFGSCSHNGRDNFSESSVTMVTENTDKPSEPKQDKILVDRVYKSRAILLMKNFKEARKRHSPAKMNEVFSKKNNIGLISKDSVDTYESGRSLVPGTRAIRESLRNKIDLVLDDIIIEENSKGLMVDVKRQRQGGDFESSTVKTKKNNSKRDSYNLRNKPTTFNPYDIEKNFIAHNLSRRGEKTGKSRPNIEILNFEKTDKKSLVPSINLNSQAASYPSILKTDNEDNLFSIFDQLTLKSTRRDFRSSGDVETPLKPINLDQEKTIENVLKERRNSKNNRPCFIDAEKLQEFYYESQCKELGHNISVNLQKSKSSIPFENSVDSSKNNEKLIRILGDSIDERFSMSKASSIGSKFCEEIMIQNLRRLSSAGKENFGLNPF